MKNGNNLSKRIYFFELLKNNMSESIVRKINNTSWTAVFEANSSKEILGITEKGEWVFEDEDRFFIIQKKTMYLHCVKLLEISYDVIKEKIENRFEEILEKHNIGIMDIFPFFEIVEFAFGNLQNDYWFNLAWMWYERFLLPQRYDLIELLNNISGNKKISQKNRQRIRKEIHEMERYVNN